MEGITIITHVIYTHQKKGLLDVKMLSHHGSSEMFLILVIQLRTHDAKHDMLVKKSMPPIGPWIRTRVQSN